MGCKEERGAVGKTSVCCRLRFSFSGGEYDFVRFEHGGEAVLNEQVRVSDVRSLHRQRFTHTHTATTATLRKWSYSTSKKRMNALENGDLHCWTTSQGTYRMLTVQTHLT